MGKRILSIILSLTLVFAFSIPAFAEDSDASVIYSSDITIANDDIAFLKKVSSIADYWYIDPNSNTLSINLTEIELKNQFNFSNEEYTRLMNQVVGTYVASDKTCTPALRAYVEGGALYIEYADLVGGTFAALVVAAEAGPAAMAAALTALGSAFGGPVGTIIGLALGLSAADLCIRVLYAVATGQGIYFKPVLSYPLLEIGYF